jgi:hypothetical protein
VQLLLWLTAKGLLMPRTGLFENPARVFEHRFYDPFSTVWLPYPVSYDEFALVFASKPSDLPALLKASAEAFAAAKKQCAAYQKHACFAANGPGAEELKHVARAAVVNSLAVLQLAQTAKTAQAAKISVKIVPGGLVHVAVA